MPTAPINVAPTSITAHQQSGVLEVGFDDGALFRIPFELMRVYSPSAEVQGHGPGQEVLQTGKRSQTAMMTLDPGKATGDPSIICSGVITNFIDPENTNNRASSICNIQSTMFIRIFYLS